MKTGGGKWGRNAPATPTDEWFLQGLTVGSMTGIAKRGWDYLWIRYADVEDPDAKMLVKRPLSVYIEQVYPYTNFAGLGIGV